MNKLRNLFVDVSLRRQPRLAAFFGCKSGQALIIVLGFVTLMTVLLLVFFESVITEKNSSKAAASGANARQLAQSAVQMVEGIITKATVPTYDTTIAWASQPGMIRTYGTPPTVSTGTGTPSSAPLAYYKLYSSSNMVINSNSTLPVSSYAVDASVANGGDLVNNWSSLPALYTDLNAPTTASDGSLVFPIVDPRAVSGSAAIEGFSYKTSTPTGSVTLNSADFGASTSLISGSGVGGTGALLPMPVQWIYVLRDGSLTSPTEPTANPAPATNVATFAGSNAPTASNPIVGRIAFWTDDDCSKVNLNTASEGTYWDPPICNPGANTGTFTYPQTTGLQDVTLASIFPAQGEYQRYPGHPATTCLSVIFATALQSLYTGTGTSAFRQNVVTTIDSASPRISDLNGTGTVSSLGGTQNATGTVSPKFDRLYASVDDFNFTPSRTEQALGTTNVTQQIIEQSRFFVTTSSKGSDLNLFGLPRVTIWPVWDTTGKSGGIYSGTSNYLKRSTTDNAMIHASTLANSLINGSVDSGSGTETLMEFTRDTALSPTIDYNLSRNQQLIAYLHNLMATGVPGFGGNFAAKYPAPSFAPTVTDSDQILTEIFDYIRSTNLADQSNIGVSGMLATGTVCMSSYTPSSPLTTGTAPMAATVKVPVGEVIPTQVSGGGRGFGRFPTISELGLFLGKIDDRKFTSGTVGIISGTLSGPRSTAGAESTSNQATQLKVLYNGGTLYTANTGSQTVVEWALVPQFFSPMCGFTGLGNNVRIQFTINGLSFGSGATPASVTLGSTTTGSYTTGVSSTPGTGTYTPDLFDGASATAATGTALLLPGRLNTNRDSVIGGVIGPMTFTSAVGTVASPAGSMYPNGLVLVPGTDAITGGTSQTMTISSGTVTVRIYSPAGASATASGVNLIQTLNFVFPSTTVPIPELNLTISSGTTSSTGTLSATGTVTTTYAWAGTIRGGCTLSNSGTTTTSGTITTDTLTYGTDASSRGSRVSGSGLFFGNGDTIRTLVPNATGTLNGLNIDGDMRLVALASNVPATAFAPSLKLNGVVPTGTGTTPDYSVNGYRAGSGSALQPGPGYAQGTLFSIGTGSYSSNPYASTAPALPAGITAVTMTGDLGTGTFPGDWDNGPGLMADGPYCNKPDEGQTPQTGTTTIIPYIGNYQSSSSPAVMQTTFFSPNRQISSPVMFGSLLVGPDHPWRTLLFRPASLPGYQVSTSYTHPGNNMATATASTAVPDHVLLDLFRMPAVEPYAISDALSTAGQINLNTQIAPFTYITRTTGLRAVMKSVCITALPTPNATGSNFINSGGLGYKYAYPQYTSSTGSFTRYCIDMDNTLAQVNTATPDSSAYPEFNRTTHTLAQPNFFVSASQICDLPLIPLNSNGTTGYSASTLSTFWQANQMTGDNALERPYSLIYPRVTTRSNTFTIHVRAQSLQKLGASIEAPTTWTEGTDQVTGEYRGSFTVEKYFSPTTATITDSSGNIETDTNDVNLPATAAVRGALWRLLYDKRFGQ